MKVVESSEPYAALYPAETGEIGPGSYLPPAVAVGRGFVLGWPTSPETVEPAITCR